MSAPEPEAPRSIGRYVLFEEVAHGGMATVHVGRLRGPAGFARTVAIKRLHAPYARDPEFVSMFLDEARLAARIQHPNVVSVLDVVAADGELFLVMDYVQGESLHALLKLARKASVQVPRREYVTILGGMLAGLHAAHEARNENGQALEIVHRDVSPQNVLLGLDGVPRVLDFGVAKAAMQVHWSTKDGSLKGKLGYMPPEQLTGGGIDRRADIYAAGVMLWEGLTGQRLFDTRDADMHVVVSRILGSPVQPPSAINPSVPPALDEITLRALAPKPADRFPTASEMAVELEKAVPPVTTRQVGEWVSQVAGEALREKAAELTRIEKMQLPAQSYPSDRPISAFARVRQRSARDDDEESSSSSRPLIVEGMGLIRAGSLVRSEQETYRPPAPDGTDGSADPGPAPSASELASTANLGPPHGRVPVPVAPEGQLPLPLRSWRRPVALGLVVVALGGALWLARPGPTAGQTIPFVAPSASATPSPDAALASPSAASPTASAAPEVGSVAAPPPTIPAPSAPPATASAAFSPPRPARPASTPRTGCDPPFTLSADGVRIPKRECFR